MSINTERIRVLHVEDEPDFADMVAEFLEREDDRISVLTATNARGALEQLTGSDIDCIISDYNMPGQNGIEFLDTVRENRPDLPFILYTGKGSEAVASDAISTGVTDYLQKENGTEQYEILANKIVSSVRNYKTEQELDNLRRQYTELVEQNLVGIYIIQQGEFSYVNPRLAEIHGYDSPDALIGRSVLELIAPEEREKVQTNLERRVSGDVEEVQYQTIGLKQHGERIDIELHGSRIEHEGEPAIIGAELDITEGKERERALRDERDFIEQAINSLDEVFYVVGVDGKPLRWNVRFSEVTGYADETIADMHVGEFFPEDEQARVATKIEETVTSGNAIFESEVLTADGTRIPYEFSGSRLLDSDGEKMGFIGIARDITARKEREEDLERKQKLLTTLYENFPEPTLTYEFVEGDSIIRDVNEAFVEVFGYEADEAIGEWVGDLIVPTGKEAEAKAIDQQVKSGEYVDTDLRRETATGERDFRFRNIQVPDSDEIGGFAVYADITTRKTRERELEQASQEYQDLFNGMQETAWVVNFDGEVLTVNDAAVEKLGYSREDLLSMTVPDIDATMPETEISEVVERVKENERVVFETTHRTKAGEGIPVEISITLIQYQGDEAILGIARDISARKKRERQMERFANMVSHDLRNPLNVAQGQLALMQEECPQEHVEVIRNAHERMGTLIDEILTLAKEGGREMEKSPIDLGDMAEVCWSQVDTAQATLNVEVEKRIQADENALRKIFENLMRNAIDHGGDDVVVTVGDLNNGFYIEDDGPGIDAEASEQVFEEGYSTTDDGTGFGLAIVKEIVEGHGWSISVTEGAGGGGRFEITDVELSPG